MMKKKRESIVVNVGKPIAIALIITNIIVSAITLLYAEGKMATMEENYVLEIVHNISSTVETTMYSYLATTEVLAVNEGIITILENSNSSQGVGQQAGISAMLRELNNIVGQFQGTVEHISIIHKGLDTTTLDTGVTTQNASNQPYYQAITQNKIIVTDPYTHNITGNRVVSVASPVRNSSGEVLGCVVLDVGTSFLSYLISDFGETGCTFILDGTDQILAHHDSSVVGQHYSTLGISGTEFTQELLSHSGSLIPFEQSGVKKIGSVGTIALLDWRLVASLDSTEYGQDATRVGYVLWSIQIVSIILVMVMLTVILSVRLRPILDINVAMKEMSLGNLHHPLTVESSDEMGELADNLRYTMDSLASYIREIHLNLLAFGKGDFTRKSELDFVGEFQQIQESTEEFVSLMTGTLDSLKATVDQVSVGSEYVATGAQNLAEGSVKQSSSVGDLTRFITDITNQIQDNAQSVTQVNHTAQEITLELERSNEKMDEMMNAMHDIQEKSESINHIVKTIEDVAFQTNILALNAAVEAARAGTAGKGFAVVAEEVRNLSSRTSDAVHNTEALISDTTEAVKEGTIIAQDTIQNLKQVTDDITGFISALDGIAKATEEQSHAINKINQEVTEIADVMHSNSAVSQESAATSEELSSQAAMMKESVEQFKTHG